MQRGQGFKDTGTRRKIASYWDEAEFKFIADFADAMGTSFSHGLRILINAYRTGEQPMPTPGRKAPPSVAKPRGRQPKPRL